jgi:hypothetical protein
MAYSERQDYIERLLALYRKNPETSGHVRPADRCLAARLYDQRVPLELVEIAVYLATFRRQNRTANDLPLNTIRSLHYFLPILHELSDPRIDPGYLDYLHYRLIGPGRRQIHQTDSHREP